jgi:hypothetical protein
LDGGHSRLRALAIDKQYRNVTFAEQRRGGDSSFAHSVGQDDPHTAQSLIACKDHCASNSGRDDEIRVSIFRSGKGNR